MEIYVLKKMQNSKHVCRFYSSGVQSNYRYDNHSIESGHGIDWWLPSLIQFRHNVASWEWTIGATSSMSRSSNVSFFRPSYCHSGCHGMVTTVIHRLTYRIPVRASRTCIMWALSIVISSPPISPLVIRYTVEAVYRSITTVIVSWNTPCSSSISVSPVRLWPWRTANLHCGSQGRRYTVDPLQSIYRTPFLGFISWNRPLLFDQCPPGKGTGKTRWSVVRLHYSIPSTVPDSYRNFRRSILHSMIELATGTLPWKGSTRKDAEKIKSTVTEKQLFRVDQQTNDRRDQRSIFFREFLDRSCFCTNNYCLSNTRILPIMQSSREQLRRRSKQRRYGDRRKEWRRGEEKIIFNFPPVIFNLQRISDSQKLRFSNQKHLCFTNLTNVLKSVKQRYVIETFGDTNK